MHIQGDGARVSCLPKKLLWAAAVGEELSCVRGRQLSRSFCIKSGVTFGHAPRKILSTCSMFLRRGGTMTAE